MKSKMSKVLCRLFRPCRYNDFIAEFERLSKDPYQCLCGDMTDLSSKLKSVTSDLCAVHEDLRIIKQCVSSCVIHDTPDNYFKISTYFMKAGVLTKTTSEDGSIRIDFKPCKRD